MTNKTFKSDFVSLYDASLEPLSKTEELELAKQASLGNAQARETLIRANIRYALSYAKKFYGHGLSNEEVNEEAVIGLIKAIDHFDYTMGYKVITLANRYIMNEIVSSCNKSGYNQRQSEERLRMILKINKALRKTNTDCSEEELIAKLSAKTGFSKKIIAELFEESLPCLSLDDSTGSEFGETRLSIIPDTASYTPEETACYKIQTEQLYQNLNKLDPLEKQIICMLYGIAPYKQEYSLAQIGKMLGESKQYIHYIKQRAIEKLKTNMDGMAA
jgi:RNA polymerase primary sigma factor